MISLHDDACEHLKACCVQAESYRMTTDTFSAWFMCPMLKMVRESSVTSSPIFLWAAFFLSITWNGEVEKPTQNSTGQRQRKVSTQNAQDFGKTLYIY